MRTRSGISRRYIAWVLVFAMILTMALSGGQNAQAKTIKRTITVKAGKTKKLQIVGGQKAKKIKWSVKNKKIAKIVKKSKKAITVRGIKAGVTQITGIAYIGKKIKKLQIKVKVVSSSKEPDTSNLDEWLEKEGAKSKESQKPSVKVPATSPVRTTQPLQKPTEKPSEILLEPGLYSTATGKMIKTWNGLLNEGILVLSEDQMEIKNADRSIEGILVIKSGITGIGHRAFQRCGNLIEVRIPDSVISVGEDPFCECSALERITVGAGNKIYDSRSNCNAIIETATNTLLAGCNGTKIPDTITSIGEYAFYGRSRLTYIQIPNSVKSIKFDAFGDCTSLTDLVIPEGVTSIGSHAFYNCQSLVNIKIPKSVVDMDIAAFPCCSGLEKIAVAQGNSVYDSRGDCNAIIETETNTLLSGCKNTVIPKDVKSIGHFAFAGQSSLAEIQLPDSIKEIGIRAFDSCSALTGIVIPSGVIRLESYAFNACQNLKIVKLSDNLEYIGYAAFGECRNLGKIQIPAKVASIDKVAFWMCSNLKQIVVEERNSIYDSRNNCNAIIETGTNTLIVGCENTVIPDGIKSIEEFAFYECRNLMSIQVPDGVQSIGNFAFAQCDKLTSIRIPDSVTEIGDRAFDGIPAVYYQGGAEGSPWGAGKVIKDRVAVTTARPTATPKPSAAPTLKPTATPTVKPTARPLSTEDPFSTLPGTYKKRTLDLSSAEAPGGGDVMWDVTRRTLVVKETSLFTLDLPREFQAGEQIWVNVIGIVNGDRGFRAYLVPGSDNHVSNIVNSDEAGIFYNKVFSWTFALDVEPELVGDGTAAKIQFKGITYSDTIDELEIDRVMIAYK